MQRMTGLFSRVVRREAQPQGVRRCYAAGGRERSHIGGKRALHIAGRVVGAGDEAAGSQAAPHLAGALPHDLGEVPGGCREARAGGVGALLTQPHLDCLLAGAEGGPHGQVLAIGAVGVLQAGRQEGGGGGEGRRHRQVRQRMVRGSQFGGALQVASRQLAPAVVGKPATHAAGHPAIHTAHPAPPTCMTQVLLTPWAYRARVLLQRRGEAPRRARAALCASRVAWTSGQPEEPSLAAGVVGAEVGVEGVGAGVVGVGTGAGVAFGVGTGVMGAGPGVGVGVGVGAGVGVGRGAGVGVGVGMGAPAAGNGRGDATVRVRWAAKSRGGLHCPRLPGRSTRPGGC